MTDQPAGSITGYVMTDSRSWRAGRFSPINGYQGRFHPGVRQVNRWSTGEATVVVLPPLNEGEFYQVQEEMDKSEGRMGNRAAGNFLNYQDAYRASAGKGVQGSAGDILIAIPLEPRKIIALDSEGNKVVMGVHARYSYQQLSQRLIIEVPEGK